MFKAYYICCVEEITFPIIYLLIDAAVLKKLRLSVRVCPFIDRAILCVVSSSLEVCMANRRFSPKSRCLAGYLYPSPIDMCETACAILI